MEFFAWRDFNNTMEIGILSGLLDGPNQSGMSLRGLEMERACNAYVGTVAIPIT